MELEVVHCIDDGRSIFGVRKVCKSQSTEDTIIEMVIEGIWQRKTHVSHDTHELFLLYRERNILDDDRSWNEVILLFRANGIGTHLTDPIETAKEGIHL